MISQFWNDQKFSDLSPSKSTTSEYSLTDSSTRKRSILSNFNFRKSENFTNFEEESIVEESSSFFDETETAFKKPEIVEKPENISEKPLTVKSNYNLDAALDKENLKISQKSSDTGPKPKRKFLKRGEGKLCVHPGARQKFLEKQAEKNNSTGRFSDGLGPPKNEPAQSKKPVKSVKKVPVKPALKFGWE